MKNTLVAVHTVAVTADGSTISSGHENYGGWCDALNLDAAGTVTMIKPSGASVTEYLNAGWNATSAKSVSAVSGPSNVLAGWCRR